MQKTLFEKIWDEHVVLAEEGEPTLLYVDLHLVHEVTSPQAFEGLRLAGRGVRRPDLTVATMDHNVPTTAGPVRDPMARAQLEALRTNTAEFGIELHATGSRERGHRPRDRAGARPHAAGSDHRVRRFATPRHTAPSARSRSGSAPRRWSTSSQPRRLQQRRPETMLVEYLGDLPSGLTPKDVILGTIGELGVDGGVGHAVEYAGDIIRGFSMEGRMTVCNMSIEWGTRAGMVAPDDTTFAYLEGRPRAPQGAAWELALDRWRDLPTDPGAAFDVHHVIDVVSAGPPGDVGHEPRNGRAGHRPGARPERLRRRRPRGRRAGARVHGVAGRDGDRGHSHRPRVPRLVHECSHRGSSRRGGSRRRSHDRSLGDGPRRAGLGEGARTGGGGGSRPHLRRRRVRVAAAPAARCASG